MARGSFTYNGKRYYVKAKTERELGAKIAQKRKDLEEGNVVVNGNTKVAVWASEWLETYKRPAVSDDWYKQLERITNNIVVPSLGDSRLVDVKPIHLQRLLNNYSNHSASYIKKIYNVINDMFKCAKSNKLILNSPADNLTVPKGASAEERRSLTDTERFYLLEVAKTHRGGLFVKFMLYCGLRPSEVSALQWKNIDLEKGILNVTSALKKNGKIGEPKSKAGYRKIPVPNILLDELRQIKGQPFDFVCKQQSGKLHTETTIKNMWNNIKREMDIMAGAKVFRNKIVISTLADDLYLYNLRHTYCTDLQSAGVPINVARELMGHSDISTTAKIYTHHSTDAFNNASVLLNTFLSQNQKGHAKGHTL